LYNDNQILKITQEHLLNAIIEQDSIMEQNKKDYKTISDTNIQINELLNLSNKRVKDLNSIFTKEKSTTVIIDNKEYKVNIKRDIGKLAIKKPILVQGVINKGTIKAFECFSIITTQDFKGDINDCK
jgi:hypothetical protein